MAEDIEITKIIPSGRRYEEARRLRGKVLREPLGMGAEVEVFPFELDSLHFVALQDSEVVGCVLFHPRGREGRLYQMAVQPRLQRCGIGRKLVATLEEHVRAEGIDEVFLHARDYAAHFYRICGYEITGDPFEEIGLKHYLMFKPLERVQ